MDVLSFGGTKNGLPFGEAVVFFDRDLAEEFARRRKQGGQLASKMRFLAAPWIGMLEDGAWLRTPRTRTRWRSGWPTRVARVPGARAARAGRRPTACSSTCRRRVIDALRARGWHFYEFIGDTGCRFMCAWDTTPKRVDAFAGRHARAGGSPR